MDTLTAREAIVYKALVDSIFATGILPDGSDCQTDLRSAAKLCQPHGICSQSFSALCGSLQRKGLYRHVSWDGDQSHPRRITIMIEGESNQRVSTIRTDIASITTELN